MGLLIQMLMALVAMIFLEAWLPLGYLKIYGFFNVACVRRHEEKIHSQILNIGILEKLGKIRRQGILVFY
jgi:hypothetical protein